MFADPAHCKTRDREIEKTMKKQSLPVQITIQHIPLGFLVQYDMIRIFVGLRIVADVQRYIGRYDI